jgi:uncharacterized C2H2 Zn-finger protein
MEERSYKFDKAPRKQHTELLTDLPMLRNSALTRLFGEGNQINSNPSTSILPFNCWICGQKGHRKVNCPQVNCFYCGKMGHLKKVCLDYRLAKMYNEEKGLDSSFSSDDSHNTSLIDVTTSKYTSTTPQDPFATSTTNPMKNQDLPEHSNIASNSIGCKDLLCSSRTHMIGNPQPLTQTTQSTTTSIEGSKITSSQNAPNSEKYLTTALMTKINPNLFRQYKTCHRCPLCDDLFVTRQDALQHIGLEHPDHTSPKPKLNRINIYSSRKCEKCKSSMSCNLINLQCSGNLCLNCLPNTVKACEIEHSNETYDFTFQLFCPLCQKPHQLDPEVATILYELKGPPCLDKPSKQW